MGITWLGVKPTPEIDAIASSLVPRDLSSRSIM